MGSRELLLEFLHRLLVLALERLQLLLVCVLELRNLGGVPLLERLTFDSR